MSVAGSRAEELRGWKQIADYLRVSIRTAQNMEKDQRLPVRRGAGIKGQVFALTNEVEEWRLNEAPSPASILQEPESPRAADKSRRQWLSAVGGSTLLAAGAGLGYLLSGFVGRGRGVPAEFRVEGSRLIVSSKDGGELWRHIFARDLTENDYRMDTLRPCLFADLSKDNKTETIFSVRPRAVEDERSVICFSSIGELLWKFVPGTTVTDNLGRSCAPPYWPNSFQVVRSRTAAPSTVVVSSNHNWSFPNQIAVLDGRTGKLLSEYWHRGHLLHMANVDIDGDGEPEVLLGGVNDAPEYKQATLVVFNNRRISGASKNPTGGVYFQGMAPGTEKKTILFPRTPVSRPFEFNRVSVLRVASGRITANVVESTDENDPCYVVYELDFNLRPVNAGLSNGLMERYRQLQSKGDLPNEPFTAVAERLKSEIVVI